MPLPAYDEKHLAAIIADVVGFVRSMRERFAAASVPLDGLQRQTMQPFFPADLLVAARIVPPEHARFQNPEFYYRARQRGFEHMPDFSHLGELTFEDVILFHAAVTDRLLFHGLVHVTQYRLLGVERYVELYLRNFARSGLHVLVPFEVQAYDLDQRFAATPHVGFSVESEVRRWLKKGRYRPA